MTAPAEQVVLVAATLLAFATTGGSSLQCYRCYINPPPNEKYEMGRMCTHFDHSDNFVVDCPFSTMCMKQDFKLQIQNGVTIHGVLRDCASQKNDIMEYVNRKWQPKTEVLEPYDEGCQHVDDKGERITNNRFCYCRGNLCNAAPKTSYHEGYTDIMGVIVVFNLTKYINSLR